MSKSTEIALESYVRDITDRFMKVAPGFLASNQKELETEYRDYIETVTDTFIGFGNYGKSWVGFVFKDFVIWHKALGD